jgi:glycerophosphoryl diester phosphodiesterase
MKHGSAWTKAQGWALVAALAVAALGCGAPERPGWPTGALQQSATPKLSWRDTPRPWIIAHRGSGMLNSHPFPANVLPGITASVLEAGAVGVEIDVMLTSDGQVVLMHDQRLEGFTDCSGCVSEHTLAEIKACKVGAPEYDLRPPTLSEVLAAIRDLPVAPLLMLDVKSDPWKDDCRSVGGTKNEHLTTLGSRIGEAVQAAGYGSNVGAQSRYPELLSALGKAAPAATLLAYHEHLRPALEAARKGSFQGVAVWEDGLTEDSLREARKSGLMIDTFTINAPVDLAMAVSFGVDVIETDFVPEMLASFD